MTKLLTREEVLNLALETEKLLTHAAAHDFAEKVRDSPFNGGYKVTEVHYFPSDEQVDLLEDTIAMPLVLRNTNTKGFPYILILPKADRAAAKDLLFSTIEYEKDGSSKVIKEPIHSPRFTRPTHTDTTNDSPSVPCELILDEIRHLRSGDYSPEELIARIDHLVSPRRTTREELQKIMAKAFTIIAWTYRLRHENDEQVADDWICYVLPEPCFVIRDTLLGLRYHYYPTTNTLRAYREYTNVHVRAWDAGGAERVFQLVEQYKASLVKEGEQR